MTASTCHARLPRAALADTCRCPSLGSTVCAGQHACGHHPDRLTAVLQHRCVHSQASAACIFATNVWMHAPAAPPPHLPVWDAAASACAAGVATIEATIEAASRCAEVHTHDAQGK